MQSLKEKAALKKLQSHAAAFTALRRRWNHRRYPSSPSVNASFHRSGLLWMWVPALSQEAGNPAGILWCHLVLPTQGGDGAPPERLGRQHGSFPSGRGCADHCMPTDLLHSPESGQASSAEKQPSST